MTQLTELSWKNQKVTNVKLLLLKFDVTEKNLKKINKPPIEK